MIKICYTKILTAIFSLFINWCVLQLKTTMANFNGTKCSFKFTDCVLFFKLPEPYPVCLQILWLNQVKNKNPKQCLYRNAVCNYGVSNEEWYAHLKLAVMPLYKQYISLLVPNAFSIDFAYKKYLANVLILLVWMRGTVHILFYSLKTIYK